MSHEFIVESDRVLVIDHDNTDPNGEPLITEISIEEYEQLTGGGI